MTISHGTRLGRYEIRSKIGSGGMGEVYLAQDQELARTVALKILPAEFITDQKRLQRFFQEARAASALNHPNILTIYEIGQTESSRFIATEFIDGETLRQHLSRSNITITEALEVAIQVASALSAAHAAGIVHRDIKPENIMLRRDHLVKVLDFGLAKLTEPQSANEIDTSAPTKALVNTEPGVVMGTAQYMSPEQARGLKVDERTDIWSLGVVLYELIAGAAPFKGQTASDTIASILKTEPQPLSRLVPEAPAEMERIVSKALEKEAADRYQTSRDLLVDLRHLKKRIDFEAELERSHAPKSRAPDHSSIESIAVLPFVNETGNSDVEYLSDGMTESLISSLSQLPHLAVKARSSVFRYKAREINPRQIAAELSVQAILIGRVVQRGQDLQLYIELVDAQSENVLWKADYNRQMTNLVALQNEIARDVAGRLQAKLSGADEQKLKKNYTENSEAYQLYLRGRFYFNRRQPQDLDKAIEYYNQAIALDPNYALAYTGLADAYALDAVPREAMPKAREATLKALSLDDRLAEAHNSLGLILAIYDYDFAGAEREFRRAIELDPNNATSHFYYGNMCSHLCRYEEALAELRRSLALEPFSLVVNYVYGGRLISARKYDEAIAQLNKTLELDANYGAAHYSLAEVYQLNGNYAESVEEFAKFQESVGEHQFASALRESFAKSGWERFLRAVIRGRPQVNLAPYYAALGENDNAFAELNKSYENREYYMVLLNDDRRLDPLRSDPRFQDLLRRVGLPQ